MIYYVKGYKNWNGDSDIMDKMYNYTCPKCGYGSTVFDNPYPYCKCCGYEDVIVEPQYEFRDDLRKVKSENPDIDDKKAREMVNEMHREKYTYHSDVFSRVANAHRIEYEKEQAAKHIDPTTYGQKPQSLPHCPTCNSTNIKKISAGAKAVSVGLFGIFSQKVKRQFHCNNCGYEW